MADFNTHLIGAAAVSGVAATVLVMSGAAPHQAVIGYFFLGVIGGLLPDIDLPTSVPVRLTFLALAVGAGFLVVFTFGNRYSLAELLVLWLGCFLLIRHGLFNLLDQWTVHRGLVHTVPMGAILGLLTVLIAFRFFNASAVHAWLCGTFLTLGFLVHLLLDEFYSVDLFGRKLLKSSFGTAFSFGTLRQPLGTAALYLAIAGLFLMCPSPKPFTDLVLDRDTYRALSQRVIPRDVWFAGLARRVTPYPLYNPSSP